MNDSHYKITAVIEKDEYGYYAYCPQLEGCQTQADSLEEIKKNIQEAIELYLSTLTEEEKQSLLVKEITLMNVEVKVA
jgi:predicted RNase H-like HicB family nuclease